TSRRCTPKAKASARSHASWESILETWARLWPMSCPRAGREARLAGPRVLSAASTQTARASPSCRQELSVTGGPRRSAGLRFSFLPLSLGERARVRGLSSVVSVELIRISSPEQLPMRRQPLAEPPPPSRRTVRDQQILHQPPQFVARQHHVAHDPAGHFN